ncbi:MAG: DHHA1 domain-containing protein [Firmicutes bacterium]|nr:DHHA1 domain-containing protein [Bacillota bacterium]
MIKLYDEDSYIKEFSAAVTDCEEADGLWKVALSQTAFFPNSGGQECDGGILDGQQVHAVEIQNDTVYHFVEGKIEMGKTVLGRIDFKKRFRNMQHHTAEHIVSGVVHSLFGYDNVGFHLSSKEVTMDYNGVLSADDVLKAEQLANEAVYKNIAVKAEYPPEDKLGEMEYRSKLDLTENVRIVKIEGVDVCACCAPHVAHTGEIGLIKLKDAIHYKGGMRIRMICGADALRDYNVKQENAVHISNMLSAKQDKIADSVERIISENDLLKQKVSQLSKKIAAVRADSLCETDGNICVFEDDADSDALRFFVNEGKKKCRIFAACNGNDKNGYAYIIGSSRVNLRECANDINSALCGRGGGTEDMIRGFFQCRKDKIEKFFGEYKK